MVSVNLKLKQLQLNVRPDFYYTFLFLVLFLKDNVSLCSSGCSESSSLGHADDDFGFCTVELKVGQHACFFFFFGLSSWNAGFCTFQALAALLNFISILNFEI